MKTLFICLAMICTFFSFTVGAEETAHKWTLAKERSDGNRAIYNIGEEGGILILVCDRQSHKLKMNYIYDFKNYDLFVFRKFGATNMSNIDNDGKFIVGLGTTNQDAVYYNVLNADKAFAIGRLPVGSKGLYDKAIAAKKDAPLIPQEGMEYFLTGPEWKKLLGSLSPDCPINFNKGAPVF